jgi:hypothetical protein
LEEILLEHKRESASSRASRDEKERVGERWQEGTTP